MSLRTALFASLLLTIPLLSHAQDAPPGPAVVTSLKGRFQDPGTQAAVAGVQVKLTNLADTTDVHRVTGKDDGTFEVTGLGVHSYRLEASRLGYAPLKTIIRVTKKDQDAGVLALTTESVPIGGITVNESPPTAVQKADTTEYRAGAVKTHRDATAEDLVQKLPGVTIEGGQVKAQGENVQQVLVNGRPFFGSDPTAAMRNLPAEVVDRIQVYDRQSDQSEFSGFEDGQAQRTMNFILRDQKMQFGKAYAGAGDQDRYQAGGNASIVRGPTRLTAIAMSNNINQRNFSPQDLFGALSGSGGGGGPRIMMFGGGGPGMRGPGPGGGGMIRVGGGGFGGGQFDPSSFLVGQQQGISTTHSGGLNYAGQWGPKLAVTSSVFATDSDTDNLQTLTRQYLPPQDSLAFYDQSSVTDSRNRNQRFDARMEWTPDSLNSVIWQPRAYLQGTDAINVGDAANTTETGTPVSAANSHTTDSNDGNNLSSRLTLRHRFAKRGRNVSAEINVGHNARDGFSTQRSLTEYYGGTSTVADTLDQEATARSRTNSFSTRIAFTEPLSERFKLQAIYNPSLTRSHSDPRGFQFDPATGDYTRPDSALSNSFKNRTTVHNGGLALLYSRGPWRLLTNASYEHTSLASDQTFPITQTIDRTFDEFVPSVTLSANFNNRRNIRLAWRASTQAPSISQLQNVVNNSNPLSLSTGNPDLRTATNQTFSVRLSEADPARSRNKFVFANVTRTSHPIGNSIFTAPFDTTLNGVVLARGTQLTRPVNLESPSWNANLFAVYSRPLTFLKSILSVNGGGTLTRTPSLANGINNLGRTYAIRSGVVLSSNISENLDFTVSYWGTYNISRNTLTTASTGDYFTHNAGLRLNAVVGPGIVLRQEVNHNLQSGVPSAYGQDVVLMNSTIGKKFLKDGRGEIRLTATDVLQENRAVSRNVTETYVQDSRDRTLGRYVQLVFTYTFRSGTTPGMGGFPGMPGR